MVCTDLSFISASYSLKSVNFDDTLLILWVSVHGIVKIYEIVKTEKLTDRSLKPKNR